jgi:uncharacterized C2H2 Zn-finger protein
MSEVYECCGMKFRSKEEYEKHIREHHSHEHEHSSSRSHGGC